MKHSKRVVKKEEPKVTTKEKIVPVMGTLNDIPIVKTDKHYKMSKEDKISVINAKQHLRAALKRAIISADVKFVQRKKESSQQQV